MGPQENWVSMPPHYSFHWLAFHHVTQTPTYTSTWISTLSRAIVYSWDCFRRCQTTNERGRCSFCKSGSYCFRSLALPNQRRLLRHGVQKSKDIPWRFKRFKRFKRSKRSKRLRRWQWTAKCYWTSRAYIARFKVARCCFTKHRAGQQRALHDETSTYVGHHWTARTRTSGNRKYSKRKWFYTRWNIVHQSTNRNGVLSSQFGPKFFLRRWRRSKRNHSFVHSCYVCRFRRRRRCSKWCCVAKRRRFKCYVVGRWKQRRRRAGRAKRAKRAQQTTRTRGRSGLGCMVEGQRCRSGTTGRTINGRSRIFCHFCLLRVWF